MLDMVIVVHIELIRLGVCRRPFILHIIMIGDCAHLFFWLVITSTRFLVLSGWRIKLKTNGQVTINVVK